MDKIKYLQYLESYLTPRRKMLFDTISSKRTRHFTLVAEDTYQDHNASALIRSCDCFGIQDLHIIEEINKYRLAKGMTQGSDKWVDLHYYSDYSDNTQICIDTLRDNGYQIVATTPHENDYLLEDFDISRKSALIFGKEKTGLSSKILDQADAYLKIPIHGFSESFNVSVSAALILQSLITRLHNSEGIDWRLSHDELIDLKIDWCLKTVQNAEKLAERYLEEHG